MSAKNAIEKRNQDLPETVQDRPVYLPDTDIYEKEDAILIRCDMPGVGEDQMDVTLEDNVLTLSGAQAEVQPEGYEQLVEEFGTGVYRRAFTVPREINRSKIKARMRAGVLEIGLPKTEQAQPKRIRISVNS